MMNTQTKRKVLLYAAPIFCGSVFTALPLKPPVKMAMMAVVFGMMSVILFSTTVYASVKRLSIPLAWIYFVGLSLSVGCGCIGTALWYMTSTWGQRLSQLPVEQVNELFVAGMLFLILGVVSLVYVARNKAQTLPRRGI